MQQSKSIHLSKEVHDTLENMVKKFGGTKKTIAEDCVKGINKMGVEPSSASRQQLAESISTMDRNFQTFIKRLEADYLVNFNEKVELTLRYSEESNNNQREVVQALNNFSNAFEKKLALTQERLEHQMKINRILYSNCHQLYKAILENYGDITTNQGSLTDRIHRILVNFIKGHREITAKAKS